MASRYATPHGVAGRLASGHRSADAVTQTPLTLRRWQRAEYERLVSLGVFRGEPIELIGGQLVVAEPQHPYHASAITAVDSALRAVLPPGRSLTLTAGRDRKSVV